jgi:hypothetical protein
MAVFSTDSSNEQPLARVMMNVVLRFLRKVKHQVKMHQAPPHTTVSIATIVYAIDTIGQCIGNTLPGQSDPPLLLPHGQLADPGRC